MMQVAENLTHDLPLVLLTLGNDDGEFEALYAHLEEVARDPQPKFQSLIVARRDVPGAVLRIAAARVRSMPSVHLLRLGKGANTCSRRSHETGSFFVTTAVERGRGV